MRRIKRISKKIIKFCELSGYDIKSIIKAMDTDHFELCKLETKKEMDLYGVDYNYPYIINDPYNVI